MSSSKDKIEARERRKASIRKRVTGTTERPRLTVFRSNKHIYAQVIDDTSSSSVLTVSDLQKDLAQAVEAAAVADEAAVAGEIRLDRAVVRGHRHCEASCLVPVQLAGGGLEAAQASGGLEGAQGDQRRQAMRDRRHGG